MRKYILNIERLFTGETADALVLNQVDEELPTLIPSIDERMRGIPAFIHKWQRIYPEFDPPSLEDKELINKYILDFNLKLQDDFKKRGHQELYLMDDTKWMRPRAKDTNYVSDKINLHLLNGRNQIVDETTKEQYEINTSQLNVIFPFRKVSSKSCYSERLTIESPYEIDNKLEYSRQMSLYGKVTSENCMTGVATVGGNLYVMSPLIASMTPTGNLISNGTVLVNSFVDKPYHFPHTLTLFQPSRDRYNDFNLQGSKTSFIDWYEKHNRKTVISLSDTYGDNTSTLKCLCSGSYELKLATYSPTDIVLYSSKGKIINTIPLNSDTFREIRSEEEGDSDNKYEDFITYDSGEPKTVKKYVIASGNSVDTTVGFKFNLFDNFISGEERILELTIPKDTDFNKLHLKFTCSVDHDPRLLGDYEYIVFIDNKQYYRYIKQGDNDGIEENSPNIDKVIPNAILTDNKINIRVVAHYQVDFSRRNVETEYQDLLKSSGITLINIRVDNDVYDTKTQLTFADYINEDGIPKDEHNARIYQFWKVSQYKRNVPYQLVLETSLNNITSSGVAYPNNYSTGDIYGDVFTTKSILDSSYDMYFAQKDKDPYTQKYKTLCASGREYLNLGQCSNQLFLVFKPINVAFNTTDADDSQNNSLGDLVITKRIEQ